MAETCNERENQPTVQTIYLCYTASRGTGKANGCCNTNLQAEQAECIGA